MTIQELGSLGEFIAAVATVATLFYLAVQIRASNRLARAEASRAPNSDLNTINSRFATDPGFQSALRKVLGGTRRSELAPEERILVDLYLVSLTNIQDQLLREVRAGILDSDALDFGGKGQFSTPYYRDSWPLYAGHLSSTFVSAFEARYELDSTIDYEL